MKYKKKTAVFFIWLSVFTQTSLASELLLEYTANAGVKITSGQKTVLIDSLFGPHDFFNALNESEFNTLVSQGADVALATHAHSDHFSGKRTAQFLKENQHALFIGTPEMSVPLGSNIASEQLETVSLTGYQSKRFSHHGIQITAFNFPHMALADHKIENFGYLVEIDGWKVFHVGDGDISANIIEGLKLAEKNIDIILIHDLFPVRKTNHLELIKKMNVNKVAFVHMTDEKAKKLSTWLKQNIPNASLLATDYGRIVLHK